ncbi:unnamed protein product [Coffea canephora]|uniref:Ycf2 N-terminal domain-containing protein n=1 Tax=Coffea canephora TaxID=49390 RepID=A0A068U102_COFCA|nr:unnamed protein product [Coffea canephora]
MCFDLNFLESCLVGGSSCKISNETVVGIEIIFLKKSQIFRVFFFCILYDDPTNKKNCDWKLFDLLGPLFESSVKNTINMNSGIVSGPLFESSAKHWYKSSK